MYPILHVGPLAIQTSGLIILLGFWLGLMLAERYAARSGNTASMLYNTTFVALISSLLGARIVTIARYPAAFKAAPLSVLSLNPGLLDPWGAIIFASVSVVIYTRLKKYDLWSLLDGLTPTLAVISIAMGLAHLASGTAFGALTNFPWGISMWGAKRHPTQIYEILSAAVILGILWPGRKTFQGKKPGVYFLSFVSLSAIARIIYEAFRGDSLLITGGIRSVQVFAWLILAASLVLIGRLRHTPFEGNREG